MHGREFGFAFLLVFAITLSSAAQAQPPLGSPTPEVLTNDDVVKMVQAGLGDSLVIAKVRTAANKFDTGMDALLKLKAAGLSEAVIQAMVEAAGNRSQAATPAAPPPDPNDPKTPHDPGIYWLKKRSGQQELVQLEPTVYSAGKSGGLFASAMTYGIKKAKWKAVVRSGASTLRFSEATPEFWFYFEEKSHGLSHSATFFGGASSPNEFILARMERKKDSRELVVAQGGAFGYSVGTRPEDTVELEFKKEAPGVYRVWPSRALKPGEYCFFYGGTSMGMGMTGGKLFDFGVEPSVATK